MGKKGKKKKEITKKGEEHKFVDISLTSIPANDPRRTIVRQIETVTNSHIEAMHEKIWRKLCAPDVKFLIRFLENQVLDPHGNPIYREINGVDGFISFIINSLKAVPDSLTVLFDENYFYNPASKTTLITCKSLLSGRKMYDVNVSQETLELSETSNETSLLANAVTSLSSLTSDAMDPQKIESIALVDENISIKNANPIQMISGSKIEIDKIEGSGQKSRIVLSEDENDAFIQNQHVFDVAENHTLITESSVPSSQSDDNQSNKSQYTSMRNKSVIIAAKDARFQIADKKFDNPIVVDIEGVYYIHLDSSHKITLLDYGYRKKVKV